MATTSSLPVSSVGLGLAALGRPAYINLGHAGDLGADTGVESLRARTHAVLDAAFEAGVRYFDVARSYGRAEEFLGSWLSQRGLGPEEVTVGSKWGYTYTGGWRVDAEVHEVKDLSLATLRRQLQETAEHLAGHLRLYQIHSATLDSGVLEDGAVLAELAQLRERGIAIGLTVTGEDQAETIRRALEVGGFDTVQATWNLMERSAETELAAAHAAGLGVIVKEGVANGRLAGREPVPLLDEAARDLKTTPDAVALAAAVGQPWSDVVLSGATSAEMLHRNLAALELEVDEGLLERLGGLRERPSDYWRARAALPWN